jgi:hypothetical protein
VQADGVGVKVRINEARDNGAAGRVDGPIIAACCHITDLDDLTVSDSYSAFE